MKKLLGVSIAALLAVSPMMANATDPDPNAHTSGTITPVNMGTNTDIATRSYVAGAYDALAAEHNKVIADIAVADGTYVDDANKIGVNVKALDTAIGEVSGASHNYIANSKGENSKTVAQNLEALDTAVGKVSAPVYNISASESLSENIQDLDAAMGTVSSLGTGVTAGSTLSNSANTSDLVTAVKAINNAVAAAGTASTVNPGAYIGRASNNSTDVKGALTALDRATETNSDAITAILTSNIPVYSSWNAGSNETATNVTIGSLQGNSYAAPAADATTGSGDNPNPNA